MVCLGNICRSPMAEVVLTDQVSSAGLADQIRVVSGGTGDWHIGRPADPRTLATLSRRGYDGTTHRAQQVSPEWLAVVDLALAMDETNLSDVRAMVAPNQRPRVDLLRSYDPASEGDLVVPDPYLGSEDDFEHALDLVEAACEGLVRYLAELSADGPATSPTES